MESDEAAKKRKSEQQARNEAERAAYAASEGARLLAERRSAYIDGRARLQRQLALDKPDDDQEEVIAEIGMLREAKKGKMEDDDDDDEDVAKAEEGEDGRAKFEDGVKIEPFNLKAEREDGFFDEAGNYVEYKLPKRLRDAWLDEVDEKHKDDMEKEAEDLEEKWRKKTKEDEKREKEEEEEEDMLNSNASKRRLFETAAALMGDKETPAAALRRLANKTTGDKAKFVELTKALDTLLSCGYVEVYSWKKDDMKEETRMLDDSVASKLVEQALSGMPGHASKKRAVPEKATEPSEEPKPKRSKLGPGSILWEYMTADGQVHGPFGTDKMLQWRQGGFFVGEYTAKVRRVKVDDSIFGEDESEEPWVDSSLVDFASVPK